MNDKTTICFYYEIIFKRKGQDNFTSNGKYSNGKSEIHVLERIRTFVLNIIWSNLDIQN